MPKRYLLGTSLIGVNWVNDLSRGEVTWGPLSEQKKKKKKEKTLAESFNVNSRAPEWSRGT